MKNFTSFQQTCLVFIPVMILSCTVLYMVIPNPISGGISKVQRKYNQEVLVMALDIQLELQRVYSVESDEQLSKFFILSTLESEISTQLEYYESGLLPFRKISIGHRSISPFQFVVKSNDEYWIKQMYNDFVAHRPLMEKECWDILKESCPLPVEKYQKRNRVLSSIE